MKRILSVTALCLLVACGGGEDPTATQCRAFICSCDLLDGASGDVTAQIPRFASTLCGGSGKALDWDGTQACGYYASMFAPAAACSCSGCFVTVKH
jgi:hypothetical protein